MLGDSTDLSKLMGTPSTGVGAPNVVVPPITSTPLMGQDTPTIGAQNVGNFAMPGVQSQAPIGSLLTSTTAGADPMIAALQGGGTNWGQPPPPSAPMGMPGVNWQSPATALGSYPPGFETPPMPAGGGPKLPQPISQPDATQMSGGLGSSGSRGA